MMFANSYQVNHSSRFAPIRSEETQQMPVRPRLVSDSLSDAHLSHGHGPLGSFGRDLETSDVFWISFLGWHKVLRLKSRSASVWAGQQHLRK